MDTPALQNGDSICQSQIGTSSLFDRKIEFHLARKPYSGVVNFDSRFQLETLNPTVVSNGNLVREVKSGNQIVMERSEGVSLGKRGFDDPELSLRISFKRIGAGLENLGNTCFLNSVLQCLTYTEPLVAYLQSGRHQSSCQIAGFCALCAIQKHVSRALHATGRSLAPKDLVSNLRCISRTFRNARQEDAHEYMVQLLESMHKCCLPKGVPSESPSAYEKSLVHKIFGGRLQSQVRCLQCSYCSNKYDPFLDLSLEIAKADNLPKALVHFTAKEQLDDGAKQYQCPQCKQKVRAVKQLTVHEAPYVLTIHLKRFSALDPGQKIDKKVAFSPKLDLKPFVSGTHEGSLMYTLYGVLVHAGWCTRSGHYYCFVRTSTGMWYSLDDNRVIQVNERTVLNQKAYMLFYVRDRKISPQKKPGCITLNEKTSSQENNLILNLTKGLKGVGQNGSIEKHVGGECSDNATKVDINMKKEIQTQEKSENDDSTPAHVAAMMTIKNGSLEKHVGVEHSANATNVTISLKREEKPGTGGSTPVNPAILKTTPSILNGTPSQKDNNISNGTEVIKPQLPTKTSGNSEGSLGNGTVTLSKEDSLKKDAFISADISPNCSMVQYSENKNAVMPEKRPQTVGDGCSSGETVTSDSTMENLANKANTTITAEMPSNLPISNKANDQMKILECNNMLKPKKRLLKPLVVTMRLSTNVMCGSSKRFLNKKRIRKRQLVFKNQSSSQIILENTVSTSDSVLVACTHRQRKEQSHSKEKIIVPVKNELHSRNTPSGKINSECNPKANPGDAVLEASEAVKCGSVRKIKGVDAKHCVNSRVEKVPSARSGLKRGLEEPIVARWDGTLASTEELASVTRESTKIGYVPDEWDEEYDRGKRKKMKSAKYSYDGTNPFQEIATSKASSIKSRNDQSSSANRPYRIF